MVSYVTDREVTSGGRLRGSSGAEEHSAVSLEQEQLDGQRGGRGRLPSAAGRRRSSSRSTRSQPPGEHSLLLLLLLLLLLGLRRE